MIERITVLTQYGYLILVSLSLIIGLDSGNVSLIFRFVLLVLYLYLLKRGIRKKYNIKEWLFIFFISIYALRFVFDIFFFNVYVSGYSFTYLSSYFLLLCLFSSISLLSSNIAPSKRSFLSRILPITLLANLLVIYIFLSKGLDFSFFQSGRLEMRSDASNSVILNPITVGHLGAALVVQTIWSMNTTKILWSSIYLLTGTVNLLLAASRGPLIVLLAVIGLIIFRKLYHFKRNTVFFFLILVPVLWYSLSFVFEAGESIYLIERLINTGNSIGEESRFAIWKCAYNDFIASPLWGHSIVTCRGNYPHNIFLEVLMSTGLLGFIPFILLTGSSFMAVINRIIVTRAISNSFAQVWWLLIFLASLFSGALFFNPLFWISTAYIIKDE